MNRGSEELPAPPPIRSMASMRPRFMNRGSVVMRGAFMNPIIASMRPRFMNRGSGSDDQPLIDRELLLQ